VEKPPPTPVVMDSRQLSFALSVSCCPPIAWLACGATFGAIKNLFAQFIRLEKGGRGGREKTAGGDSSFVSFVLRVLYEVFLVFIEVVTGFCRTVVVYIPLFGLIIMSYFASMVFFEHYGRLVVVTDAFYESVRPNILETMLQMLNFARVVFALLIGVWNALIDIAMIPIRLLFDSALRCGGAEFVRVVAMRGSDVVRAFTIVMFDFFAKLRDEGTLDVDLTSLTYNVRQFLIAFADVIECSCESISGPILRTVLAPLWSNSTDVFANSASRTAIKVLEIPYAFATSGRTSFEPLFEVVLSEHVGMLASGATVLNEHLGVVLNFIQQEVPEGFRFGTPPLFSIPHRLTGMVVSPIRVVIQLLGALPTLINSNSRQVADQVYASGSSYNTSFHAEKLSEVVFIDTLASVHEFLRPYGELLSGGIVMLIKAVGLVYNTTLVTITGVSTAEHVPGNVGCDSKLAHTDNPSERIRYGIIYFSTVYSEKVVPTQLRFALAIRQIIDRKLLMVAMAESSYSVILTFIRFIDASVKLFAYMTDAVLRLRDVRHNCISGFYREMNEQITDTLTSLPNLITSFLDLDDTTSSGYGNLVCARTTHVNHIYSGSLKAYVFASGACDAHFKETGEIPKCSYRDDDKAAQDIMCEKLIAFADYNSNPICNLGDMFVELIKSGVYTNRLVQEYYIGMIVAVWNCVNNPLTADGFIECASSVTRELIPPKVAFELAECQTAELLYRLSAFSVSMLSPMFGAVYRGTGYPQKGYYTSGADDVEHVQAFPIEAAITTLTASVVNILYWVVHAVSRIGVEIVDILQKMHEGSFDLERIFTFRYTILNVLSRAWIIGIRDILVGTLQVGRAIATVIEYSEQADKCKIEVPACVPDPRLPHPSFTDFQKAIITVVELAQDFQEFIQEVLWMRMEVYFDLFYLLLKGLMEGDSKYIREFFVAYFNAMGKMYLAIINGATNLLLQEGSPFRFLCTAVDNVRNGICQVMTSNWVPSGLKISCGANKSKCSWWPFPGGTLGLNTESDQKDGDGLTTITFAETAVDFEGISKRRALMFFQDVGHDDEDEEKDGPNQTYPYRSRVTDKLPNVGSDSASVEKFASGSEDSVGKETLDDPRLTAYFERKLTIAIMQIIESSSHASNVVDNVDEAVNAMIAESQLRDAFTTAPRVGEEIKKNITFFVETNRDALSNQTTGTGRRLLYGRTSREERQAAPSGSIGGFFESVGVGVVEGAVVVGEGIEDGANALADGVVGAVNDLAAAAMVAYEWTVDLANSVAEFASRLAGQIWDELKNLANAAVRLIIQPLMDALEKNIIKPLETATGALVDTANALANAVEDAIDAVKETANKAVRLVNEVKNKAVELANKVAKLPETIWNKIYSIVPTSFELKTTSVATLVWGSASQGRAKMSCDTKFCDGILSPGGCDTAQEATVCSREEDCQNVEKSFCVTADQDLCPTLAGDLALGGVRSGECESGAAWAKACKCSALTEDGGVTSYPSHCNYASGFCTAGATPFTTPLEECATAGGLVYGSVGYNALCYVSPIWTCAYAEDKAACRSHLGLQLQGPSLCRSFCEPTFENRNNRLAQYEFNTGPLAARRECVCEVGVDRVFPTDLEKMASSGTVIVQQYSPPPLPPSPPSPPPPPSPKPSPPPVWSGRRRLLDELYGTGKKNGFEHGFENDSPYTRCFSNADCAPSFAHPTLCRSLWDTVITCYSCSERVSRDSHSLGYACSAESKRCECTSPPVVDPEDESARTDDTEWRGNSWCDNLMRAYRHSAVRTPLENAWVYKCSSLRAFGVNLAVWLNLQTIPPDIMYNPTRPLSLLFDVAEGVYVYFSEGWVADEKSREEFFDRLVERSIDPILTFKALDVGQKVLGIGRAMLTELDYLGGVSDFIGIFSEEASGKFDEAVVVTSNTIQTFVNVTRNVNTTALYNAAGLSLTPMKKIIDITAEEFSARRENVTVAIDVNVTDDRASMVVIQHGFELEANEVNVSHASRHLLAFECEVIMLLKDRLFGVGDILTEYYGTDNAYLANTLCAYENFLLQRPSGQDGCPEHGQSGTPPDLADNFTVPGLRLVVGFDPLSMMRNVDNWMSRPQAEIVTDVIGFARQFSFAPISCDKDTMLCKNKKRSLVESFVIVQAWIVVVVSFSWFSGLSFLSTTLFINAQIFILPAAVLYLTYGYSLLCAPKLPVCVGDDMFALATFMFPEHISWPQHTVSNVTRTAMPQFEWFKKLDADITDCGDVGISDGFDTFFWFREYFIEHALNLPRLVWSVIEWPLVQLVPGIRATSVEWKGRVSTPIVQECALVNVLSVVPLLLVSFFVLLALSFALLPCLRFSMMVFGAVFSHIIVSLRTLLDIYGTGGE